MPPGQVSTRAAIYAGGPPHLVGSQHDPTGGTTKTRFPLDWDSQSEETQSDQCCRGANKMSLFPIERKALLVGLLVLVAIGVMAWFHYRAVSDYQLQGQLRLLVRDIESNILTLRRNEKDFLARKDLMYQQRFDDNFRTAQANVRELRSGLDAHHIEDTKIDRLEKSLETYKDRFHAMVKVQQEIGFNHEDGLYGRMRDAIHRVEDILQTQRQDQLLKDMLMLRRHEKDFMLRHEIKYSEKFDESMTLMRADLSRSYLYEEVRRDIVDVLAAYERDFKALTLATQRMGFSSDEGLHGQMRDSIHEGEEILNELRQKTLSLESDAGSHMINQIIAFAVLLTILTGTLIRR